jgi:thiamine-monophosphate kinase
LDSSSTAWVTPRLLRPTPRVAEGKALRTLATSAIDVSDGLIADLRHILKPSAVGAQIYVDALPLSPALQLLPEEEALTLALSAGDDYELCFTLPPQHEDSLRAHFPSGTSMTCIGQIVEKSGSELLRKDGTVYHCAVQGYLHF